MADGQYIIVPGAATALSGAGPWAVDANLYYVSTLGYQGPATTGAAQFTFGGNNLIYLIPTGSGVAIPTRIQELPFGFQFLDLNQSSVGGPPVALEMISVSPFTGVGTIATWSVTSLGWSAGTTPFTPTVQEAMLVGITANATYNSGAASGVLNGATLINPGQDANGLLGTYDALGPQVTPGPIDVEVGPGDNEITITPGPDTVVVIIEEEGQEEVVIAVTPGVPVVVPVTVPNVTVIPVNYPIVPGTPVTVEVPIVFEVEGLLVIDMALAPTIRLIGDPSGIYTLIPNQRFDVLYERAAGTTTTQTVQIPRPFGITSYVPEQD